MRLRSPRLGEPTIRIGSCLNDVQQLHVRDVIDVDLHFEDDDQGLAVELDSEDGRGKEELADHGLPLCDASQEPCTYRSSLPDASLRR